MTDKKNTETNRPQPLTEDKGLQAARNPPKTPPAKPPKPPASDKS